MLVTSTKKQSHGFTLIEVIVAITVIAVLVALFIPAVQYAREASRKLSCVNSLKQFGLALNNYEASFRVYPQGANGGLYSAHIMMLPFLDQGVVYNSINFNAANAGGGFSDGEANATIGNTRLAVFYCPSDPDSMKTATTNYAWNGGLGFQMGVTTDFARRSIDTGA